MSLTSPTAAEIRAFRAEMKLSQAKLAQALGVSTRAVEDWEAERRTPPPYLQLAFKALREAATPAVMVESAATMKQMRTAQAAPAQDRPHVDVPLAGTFERKPMQKGTKK